MKTDFIIAHNRIFITIKNQLISIYRFQEPNRFNSK